MSEIFLIKVIGNFAAESGCISKRYFMFVQILNNFFSETHEMSLMALVIKFSFISGSILHANHYNQKMHTIQRNNVGTIFRKFILIISL